ncbi:O-antigen ligase family protein [Paraburkholderia sp. CNPSo 3281]|uniref:O-antigen ligase family protein n=1 Tax=Paraburkholderia sp. CNPSo 3281 TaxID=2940933 RepID=UPI0020B67978|nr:O-antigen ligase family protein [Paraburkholderia sp. CNPSo 3281]MCP3714152.1 O-antigen ligase family protein [Paraburkholderia sp. CNPSo 3281]
MIWLILLAGIALSPFSDFLSVYALKGQVGGDMGARYSLFVRGAMVAGLIAMMLFSGRVRLSNWRICLLALVVVTMSCVSLAFDDMAGGEFVEEVIVIAKVFSLFVYVAAFSELTDAQLEKVEALMRVTLLVYALAILAGAVFSIDIFRSYRGGTQIRAGYKGIIYAQNEASGLLLSGLALAYLHVVRNGWSARRIGLIVALFVAAFLLGTKGALVTGFGVVAAYSYARYGVIKASVRLVVVVAMMSVIAVAVYFIVPFVHQAVDLSIQYFRYQSDHAGGGKIATVLMSGRDIKFSNVWDELASRDFLPLLTGGYPIVRYLIEMDGPDLTLIMGIPVFCLYLRDIFRLYAQQGDGHISHYGSYFLLLLMMIACSAGHVLTSAIVAPYLAVIADLVRRWSDEERRAIADGR